MLASHSLTLLVYSSAYCWHCNVSMGSTDSQQCHSKNPYKIHTLLHIYGTRTNTAWPWDTAGASQYACIWRTKFLQISNVMNQTNGPRSETKSLHCEMEVKEYWLNYLSWPPYHASFHILLRSHYIFLQVQHKICCIQCLVFILRPYLSSL